MGVGVFDLEGRLMWRQAGSHDAGDVAVAWDGLDLQGRRVHPGRYQVRVITAQGIRQVGVVRL